MFADKVSHPLPIYKKKKPLPCPSSVPNDSPETPSSSTAHHNPSKAAAIPSSPPLGLCGYIDLLGESKEDSLHSAQGNWEGQERAGMLRSHNTFPVSQRFVVEHEEISAFIFLLSSNGFIG